jgi:hypothetical protein
MSKSKLERIQKYGITAVFSIVLAFPLSGATIAIYGLAMNPSVDFHHPLGALMTALIGAVWFGVATTVSGGFPITDEGGVNRMNAYPFIIATAVIMFFIFCRGWHWFRRAASRNRS